MVGFTCEVQIDERWRDAEGVDGELLALVETAVQTTLQSQQVSPPAGLTLLLTNDAHIHRLNQDYLGQDRPTDVLSFPAGEPMPGMGDLPAYLGDVIISVPFAGRQAATAGHSLAAELQLLAVHGVLHLLGHDHATPEEKTKMWAAQTAVLRQLGLLHVAPTGNEYDDAG